MVQKLFSSVAFPIFIKDFGQRVDQNARMKLYCPVQQGVPRSISYVLHVRYMGLIRYLVLNEYLHSIFTHNGWQIKTRTHKFSLMSIAKLHMEKW